MCNYASCGLAVSGSGDGEFNLPRGVAVDRSGNVYVTDSQNSRVENFSGGVFVGWAGGCTSGSHCTSGVSDGFTCTYSTCGASIGGYGDGEFYQPDGIAIDSAGDIYVADSSNSRVELFSSSGVFEGWAGGCTSGLHCSSGESDGFTCTYATCGAPVAGGGNGQFNLEVYGVAVDSSGNNVYVTDFYSNRVEKFSGGAFSGWAGECTGGSSCDTAGGVDHSIGFTCTASTCTGLASGSEDGQFDEPLGVAVDRSGNVYVTDSDNYRVEKFDSSGNFLLTWGSYGVGNGEFIYPYGVAVDSSGNNVYVVDQWNHRVQLFTSSGTFVGWAGKCDDVSGSNCKTAGLTVQEYYSTGFTCTTATCGNSGVSNYGSTDGQFYYPWGVAVDSAGNVYVADEDNNRIQLFAAPPMPSRVLITEVDSGLGSVSPNCPGPTGCSETVGSPVSVMANAAAGYGFSSWSLTGASCSNGSTSNPCAFSMPDNTVTVSATFAIKIPLVQGWNLISLPAVPNSTVLTAAQLKSSAYSLFFTGPANSVDNMFNKTGLASVTSVWTYNGKSWLSCVVSAGSCSGTLTTMVDGAGYWVLTTSSSVVLGFNGWSIQPLSSPPSYSLVQGWNLVGFTPEPTIGQESTSSYLSSLNGNYNRVYLYDNTSGTWSENPAELQPGQAVWVYVTAPITLRP